MMEYIMTIIGLVSLVYMLFRERQYRRMIKTYQPLAEQAMTMLSSKGVETREVKAIEQRVTEDLMTTQTPELSAITSLLKMVSPETANFIQDMIRKNPQIMMILYQKYKPIIDELLKTSKTEHKQASYDF